MLFRFSGYHNRFKTTSNLIFRVWMVSKELLYYSSLILQGQSLSIQVPGAEKDRINKQKSKRKIKQFVDAKLECDLSPLWVENVFGKQEDGLNVPENLIFFILPFPKIGVRVILPARVTWWCVLITPQIQCVAAGDYFIVRFVRLWIGSGAAPQTVTRREGSGSEPFGVMEASAKQQSLP